MDKYKKLWEKLKVNITDQNILNLMIEYEQEAKIKHRHDIGKKYGIKLTERPWYNLYRHVMQLLYKRLYKKLISKTIYTEFKKEFTNWIKLLAFKKATDEDIYKWLMQKCQEYIVIKKDITHIIKKPLITPSGFTRKISSKMTLEERAAVIIDELIYRFEPQIPNSTLNLNIDYYKEDWRQELWAYCWRIRNTDPNLKALIINYNALSNKEYIFRSTNFLSRMNKYIVSYIAKLQYPINDIAQYNLTTKFSEEELYPADDLSVLENMNIDLIEKPKYVMDDIELDDLDNKQIVNDIMNFLEDSFQHNRYCKKDAWLRYKKVLEMRYGLNEYGRVYSLQEIANSMNITRQRVQQMEVTALRDIKQYIKKVKE